MIRIGGCVLLVRVLRSHSIVKGCLDRERAMGVARVYRQLTTTFRRQTQASIRAAPLYAGGSIAFPTSAVSRTSNTPRGWDDSGPSIRPSSTVVANFTHSGGFW